ncbi:MAG: oligoendopeptidase F, partial [Clostridia bacterium]|nr:oligoendopeptidase F [Clostridia bacterium]
MEKDLRFKWATEDLYKTCEDWEKDFKAVSGKLDFSAYKGKLGDKTSLKEYLSASEKVSRALEKLYLFAHMRHDENTKDSLFDSMLNRVMSVFVKFESETSFVVPELTSLDESVLKSYIEDEELKDYDYALKCILKDKPHVLSESEEKLLSFSSEALSSFQDIFSKIDNADLPLKN